MKLNAMKCFAMLLAAGLCGCVATKNTDNSTTKSYNVVKKTVTVAFAAPNAPWVQEIKEKLPEHNIVPVMVQSDIDPSMELVLPEAWEHDTPTWLIILKDARDKTQKDICGNLGIHADNITVDLFRPNTSEAVKSIKGVNKCLDVIPIDQLTAELVKKITS